MASEAKTRHRGRIARFREEFGFIKEDGTGIEAFVHISAMANHSLPLPGALVTYDAALDKQGRLRASCVAVIRADFAYAQEARG